MSNGTLRTARLEAKACLLGLGPWPWGAATLFLAATWIQEPSFFRQQGLDLAWPAAAAISDSLSLLLISQLLMFSTGPGARVGRGLAALLLVGLSSGSVLSLGLGLDGLLGRATELGSLVSVALRPFLLWPAVCLVALGASHRTNRPLARLLWVLFAFGVQAALLPVDVALWERSLHSWLAVVGTFAAGSAFLTSVRRPERRGDLPCA